MKRSLLLLACLLFAAWSLTGCSTATPPSNSMTLKVGYVTDDLSSLPLQVALQQKMFEQQGLTLDPLKPSKLNGGGKLTAAVEANSLEIGIGSISNVYTISRVDAHIKIIGALCNAFLLDIAASNRFEQEAHVSAASTLHEKIQALRGKKVGISGPNSATDALVTYLFKLEGLDPQKDVVKVNLGADSAAQLAALQAGRVDAIATGTPTGEVAKLKGFGETFISPVRGDIPSMRGQLFLVAYTKDNVISAKSKAIAAFIRALAQSEAYIQNNPLQAKKLLTQYLKVDQKTGDAAWNVSKTSFPTSPQVDRGGYDRADQFHVKAGLIALPLHYEDLVDTQTITNALA